MTLKLEPSGSITCLSTGQFGIIVINWEKFLKTLFCCYKSWCIGGILQKSLEVMVIKVLQYIYHNGFQRSLSWHSQAYNTLKTTSFKLVLFYWENHVLSLKSKGFCGGNLNERINFYFIYFYVTSKSSVSNHLISPSIKLLLTCRNNSILFIDKTK